MKKIILTKHAKEQMQNRSVSEKDIEHALHNPNIKVPAKGKKRTKVLGNVPGKSLLKIICREMKKKFIIITVCWEGK